MKTLIRDKDNRDLHAVEFYNQSRIEALLRENERLRQENADLEKRLTDARWQSWSYQGGKTQ